MEPQYRIAWRSKLTGATGHGEAAYSLAAAQEIARKANEEVPELSHWAELVDNPQPGGREQ